MTPITRFPFNSCKFAQRTNLLLLAVVGVVLALSSTEAFAQATATPDESAKAAEQSKDKAQTPASVKPASSESAVPIDAEGYRIGLADQLMISVWKEPELSLAVVVRPDGMITLPLVNDVHVVGLKPVELQQLLTEKLKPFLTEPQVTVIVQGIRSRKVYLVGNVSKQGAYPLEGGETVMLLLAASGGVGPFAKADSIYILRTENNKQIRIPFQYKKALRGKTKEDIALLPGDVIVVP